MNYFNVEKIVNTQVKWLAHWLAQLPQAARAAQLGPHGQQGLQQAHQAHLHGHVNGHADRQRGQRVLRVAPGNERVSFKLKNQVFFLKCDLHHIFFLRFEVAFQSNLGIWV